MEQLVFLSLDIIGTIAFAASGALAAMRKGLDLLGVIIIGGTTAIGGGIIRDIILGIHPPQTFADPQNAIIAVIVAIIVFFYINIRHKVLSNIILSRTYTLCDALGIGIFVVSGVNVAIEAGFGHNFFLMTFVGSLTGLGGGVLRDVFLNTIPVLLKSDDIYATTAICGALLYALLLYFGLSSSWASLITIGSVVIIRLAGQQLWLHMPYSKMED